MNDTLPIRGDLHIVVKDAETGTIKLDRLEKNLVVTSGKQWLASRMANATASVMGWIAVGTDATAAVVGDTTLGLENARVATTVSGGTPSTNTVTFVATFPAGQGTGALTEAGIFNASSSGTMLSRTTYSVINKGSGDEMTITWVISIG